MTDYTDLKARLREPIIGDAHGDGLITSGRLAERLIRERGEAAAAIAALTAERDGLQAQVREMALDALAASGQAQEAYRAQIVAEAERNALRDALQSIEHLADNDRIRGIARAALTAPTTGG